MFVRTLAVGFSFAVVLSSTAAAQCGSVRRSAPLLLARQIAPIIDSSPGEVYVSSTPSLNELARQASDDIESRYPSCESHRIQNERWAAKQRKAAHSKPVASAPPAKRWTKDELAASKFEVAHLLWRAGRTDVARHWLETVLREYENTPTAERARLTLARL